MKKLFICVAVSSFLASCTSNNESIVETDGLVPVVIDITTDIQEPTRAYLGFKNTSDETQVPVIFQEKDRIIVNDGVEHPFTVTKDGSSTKMTGSWLESTLTCCAVYGKIQENKEATNYSATTGGVYIDGNGNQVTDNTTHTSLDMHFELPTTQYTYSLKDDIIGGKDNGVTCQQNALLAFAVPYFKGITMHFIPIVSYLYFTSAQSKCQIVSNDFIAGNFDVNYKDNISTNISGYTTAEDLWNNHKLTYKASSHTIECNGKPGIIAGMYTYVVAIKPGEYVTTINESENSIGIKILVAQGNGSSFEDGNGFYNKRNVTFKPNVVYDLGCVDPAPAGAPARGVEPTTLPFGR